MDLPVEVAQFVNKLVPTDVGVDSVGDFVIHYEGFTDECNDGHDDESIDQVYAEVYQDFDDRQDKDIDDLPGSQPASFQMGIKKKSTKPPDLKSLQYLIAMVF